MVIEFDNLEWQRGSPGPHESGRLARPDWHGLQARLRAARDAARVFAAGGSTSRSASCGSFDGSAARWIVDFGQDSAFVNPNDSAIRNASVVKVDLVADESKYGDRG
jgi:hypothetical protein